MKSGWSTVFKLENGVRVGGGAVTGGDKVLEVDVRVSALSSQNTVFQGSGVIVIGITVNGAISGWKFNVVNRVRDTDSKVQSGTDSDNTGGIDCGESVIGEGVEGESEFTNAASWSIDDVSFDFGGLADIVRSPIFTVEIDLVPGSGVDDSVWVEVGQPVRESNVIGIEL